jgi:exonuclease SbcC
LPGAEAAAQQARDHSYDMMAAFIATQAPRLAAELIDGEPCSVCGATSHPNKAAHSEAEVVDHDRVEAARQAENTATTRRDSVVSRIETLRGSLGSSADEALDSLQALLAAVAAELRQARDAATEVARLQPLHVTAQTDRAAADAAVRSAEVAAAELAATAGTKREEAERLATEAAAVDLGRLEARERSLADLHGVGDALGVAQQSVTAAESVLTTQRSAAHTALVNSGFASADDAAAAVLDADTEQQAARRVEAWAVAKQNADTRLGQLHEQGVPTLRPDADALAAVAVEARRDTDELARRITSASNELDRASESIDEGRKVGSESLELRSERDDARIVFRTCNGEAGMGVKLERWVLSGELERVTQAANVHLARMSNGRYRLGRKGGRNALDLEVFDSNTGRARATASLSGGEQFQASLSLALGLADVVSHGGTASGKLFEALFVDEGFGSLDPKALDQAIEALLMIQQGGRMVGAITHVEGMKERLHPGIEVSARPDGRGSTLSVNP